MSRTYWIIQGGKVHGLVCRAGRIVTAPGAPWAVGRWAVEVLDRLRNQGAQIDWTEHA